MRKLLFVLFIVHCSLLITNAQWVPVRNGMGIREVRSLASGGNYLYAGTNNYGVFLTMDYGTNWKSLYSTKNDSLI